MNKQATAEGRKQYHKENYEKNRESKKQWMREYRRNNKDKTQKYYRKRNKKSWQKILKLFYKKSKKSIYRNLVSLDENLKNLPKLFRNYIYTTYTKAKVIYYSKTFIPYSYSKSLISGKVMGVYCIENIQTKKRYIGQSTNIPKRVDDHKRKLRVNKHHNLLLQRAWNKYGELSFDFYILQECNINDLDKVERMYINHFDTLSVLRGYNLEIGGNELKILTPEHRDSIRKGVQKYFEQRPR